MPSPKLHEASQQLSQAVDAQTGELARGWTKQEITELVSEATAEFWASDLGQQLLERGGPEIEDQVIDIMAHRFEQTNFALCPFYESLVRVGKDLLESLPKPVAPKVEPAPKAAPVITAEMRAKAEAEAKEKADRIAKVKQYAHLYNSALLNHGIGSLKSNGGFVTVRVGVGENMKAYEYPAAEANALLNEAIGLGLIR